MISLTPEQYGRIVETMAPQVREKITRRFLAAMDSGHDIYEPATGLSPAGEAVMAEMVKEARRMGWDAEVISMLRWNIRAIGRALIIAAMV